MTSAKEVLEFLSAVDSLQHAFRETVLSRQLEDRAKEYMGKSMLDPSIELSRQIDSQRGNVLSFPTRVLCFKRRSSLP
jgi:hypothetical protein